MTSTTASSSEIRERLDHPVIDTDGHMMEHVPVFLQFLGEVAGGGAVERFKARSYESRENSWHTMTPEERRHRRMPRAPFWQSPAANTEDRATAMLPSLLRSRMDELGFDFSIVYPTLGFYLIDETDDDVRREGCRAHNAMTAELFAPHADRLTPAACIPTNMPEEAITELEYAVNTLGHKAVMVCNLVHRPIAAVEEAAPEIAHLGTWTDALALDSEYDYDPFWARCRDLGVAVTVHSRGQQRNARRSVSNYMNNQINHFAEAGDIFARALFFGGVTHRFPDLNFGLLEGGVGWACSLFAKLVGAWDKRNPGVIDNLNPANIDLDAMQQLFDEFGGARFAGTLERRDDEPTSGKRDMGHVVTRVDGTWSSKDIELKDDLAACGIDKAEDIVDRFIRPFYFGCEADDPMNATAFGKVALPFGARPQAMFGSDIGHWDVTDMNGVLAEAYEMVEDGLITEDDFRNFTFGNPARLHAGMNPDFFEGTVVENAVKDLIENSADAQAAE